MKITLLTQYYPPETGAPQNRLHSLAVHLKGLGHDVEVITALPHYPQMRVFDGYGGRFLVREQIDGIPVTRSWVYVAGSRAIVQRLLNQFSFVFTSVIAGLRVRRADYLLCESPPLFLGMAAVLLSRLQGAKLIFNVSDLWPESAEKLGLVNNRTILRLTYALEAWLYRRSHLVTGQTQGIVSDITRRFPSIRTLWMPNGVDRDVYDAIQPDAAWRPPHLRGKKVFLYAGILGHAQGLEVIVEAAAALADRSDVAFVIVGDGPRKPELGELNQRLAAGVVFVPNTPKAQVLRMVADAYACIVPLRKLDLFKGAIPSKLFDPLGLRIPIVLGVEGEAKSLFIDQGGAGLCFEPENAAALAECIRKLADDKALRDRMGAGGHEFVSRHFDRRNITAALLKELGA